MSAYARCATDRGEEKRMAEYIVRDTGCPEAIKDIVGELVRCKDCRWWERDYHPRHHSDERPCNIVGMGTLPDWYCADGEVRDDDTD